MIPFHFSMGYFQTLVQVLMPESIQQVQLFKATIMKIAFVFIALILGACQPAHQEDQSGDTHSFYVGTYTDGKSKGIYQYILQPNGMIQQIGLAAVSDNPSFLALSKDKKYLVAVNEINQNGTGKISSFRITGDTLQMLSQNSSGGGHPCFVSVNEAGFVLTANYTGGSTGLLKLDREGKLSGLLDLYQHKGSGTTPRQEGPHAHSAWFEPAGNSILSVDLGTNELWFFELDTNRQKLEPRDQQKLQMTSGAGPRHLVFHPHKPWIYVVNELNATLTLVRKTSDGRYEMAGSVSTLPKGYEATNKCADIHISPDGKFVYASNRGHNSIAIFRVDSGNGNLQALAHQSVHGDWPRNFSLSPDGKYLIVANRHSNNLVSLKRDPNTGLLEYTDQIEAPSPVCILFKN